MRSSVVERCPDKTEAEGPIPSAPTINTKHGHMAVFGIYSLFYSLPYGNFNSNGPEVIVPFVRFIINSLFASVS